MIRPKKFTRVETVILWIFAALLILVGGTGLFLSAGRAEWTLALASIGLLGIAAIYLRAACRGKPL